MGFDEVWSVSEMLAGAIDLASEFTGFIVAFAVVSLMGYAVLRAKDAFSK